MLLYCQIIMGLKVTSFQFGKLCRNMIKGIFFIPLCRCDLVHFIFNIFMLLISPGLLCKGTYEVRMVFPIF
jgi:hypothetical protein